MNEPKLNSRDFRIYDAMKDLIVGDKYYQAKDLIVKINYHCNEILIPFGHDNILRNIIKKLRRSSLITRIIESNLKGYRMPIENPIGISLIGIRTLKSIETCLLSNDLTPELIYAKVNELRNIHHAKNNQQRLQVGKYTNTEVKRNSKDIYKGENNE